MNHILRVPPNTSEEQSNRLLALQAAFAQVCNAIYCVLRTSRLVFQHPNRPLNLSKLDGKPLPLISRIRWLALVDSTDAVALTGIRQLLVSQ